MHTIAIEYDMRYEVFVIRKVDHNGEKGEVFALHDHFLDAQQHALMLLSDTGDFRYTIQATGIPEEPGDA